MSETPREVMNRADGLRERARALDHIRLRMRLGSRPVQRGRHFFSKPTAHDGLQVEVHLTPQEDQLFYEWATAKQREYEVEADRLDATLAVRSEAGES